MSVGIGVGIGVAACVLFLVGFVVWLAILAEGFKH